jgi:hypothetical protein
VRYFEILSGWISRRLWHTVGMPKRLSKSSQPSDINQAAFQMVRRSTGTEDRETPRERRSKKRFSDLERTVAKVTRSDISRVMSAMGRKGGKVGGKRRMVTMTAEQRREVAQKAANTRWAKHSNEEQG